MFNYGREKRKFDLKWEKLKNEYKKLGMPDDDILEIYTFDLEEFNSTRKYYRYLEECTEDSFKGKASSNFEDEIASSVENDARIEWIEDERLYQELKKLKKEELEILIMYIIQGYNQREIAQKLSVNRKKICRNILKIKKFIK